MTPVLPVLNVTRRLAWLMIIACVVIYTSACEQAPQLKPLPQDAVILAFGNSLTFGTGAGRDQSYPAQLQQLLSRTVINEGVPGETTTRALSRLPKVLSKHRPDLVLLCHGGNDILQRTNLVRTRDNLQQMIELIQNQGAEVILIGVPRFGLFLESAPLYRELAEMNNIPIENEVLGNVLGKASLIADRVHPNATGYAIMAEWIYGLMQDSGAI